MMKLISLPWFAGLLAVVITAGCDLERPSRTVTKSVPLGTAQAVDVSLEMNAGELHLSDEATALMDGTFHISESDPIVEYSEHNGRGALRLREPQSAISSGTTNEWTVQLRRGVPMEFNAHLRAGEAKLALGALDLRKVIVQQGVGELELDLRGTPRHSFDVYLNGGVGESRVLLPKSVALEAEASNGIGEIKVDGLQKRGNIWVNPGHENDAVKIRVSVTGGVGEIHISAE
jgi:hypothetical protein